MPRIIYSRHYDIGFFGIERLHPFDSHKYGRAWRRLCKHFGRGRMRQLLIRPPRGVTRRELLAVHSPVYLHRLRDSKYVAAALELPPVGKLPAWIVDWRVLRPMRWATAGTSLAAREAMACGFAVNLSGGYHHAKPGAGEGFCIYADIALAVHALREEGALASEDRVAYVDLDAHQGNGVCHTFMEDRRVFLFDMFNSAIYPAYDREARERIDCAIPLSGSCTGAEYLDALESKLPPFLDSIGGSQPVCLAIYNAGTDVFEEDQLGGLHLSAHQVLARDLFVVGALRARGIPTVMLLSGGYSQASYRLVADSVRELIREDIQTGIR